MKQLNLLKQDEQLEAEITQHKRLTASVEQLPSGDKRHLMQLKLDKAKDFICHADTMQQGGKSIYLQILRIRQLLNSVTEL